MGKVPDVTELEGGALLRDATRSVDFQIFVLVEDSGDDETTTHAPTGMTWNTKEKQNRTWNKSILCLVLAEKRILSSFKQFRLLNETILKHLMARKQTVGYVKPKGFKIIRDSYSWFNGDNDHDVN